MARKVQVFLVDDLDGTDLGENGETVKFALDGTSYELDLSGDNAQKMRDAFGRYAQHARKVTASSSGGGRRSSSSSNRSDADREHTKAVRTWAVANGHMRPESRGRIPTVIREAYEAHQRGEQYELPGMGSKGTTPTLAQQVKADKANDKSTTATAKGASSKDKDKVPATA